MKDIEKIRPELDSIREQIPQTYCDRRTSCCALLPEMTFVEAGVIMKQIELLNRDDRNELLRKIMAYYFLNPVMILGCPFLEGKNCCIYQDRPFGCRAYGLWSFGHYRRRQEQGLSGKKQVRRSWEQLGVILPKAVTAFSLPYCRSVRPLPGVDLDDRGLVDLENEIQSLDRNLPVPAREFSKRYYNDLSFLVTADLIGYDSALRNKVAIVKEYLAAGTSPGLEYLLDKVGQVKEETVFAS